MAKTIYFLACLAFIAAASSDEDVVAQGTCKGCDESALVQKDMTIRSYAAATSERAEAAAKAGVENRIQHYQIAAASIARLVKDMNTTMMKHFKETGRDHSYLVDKNMEQIMEQTRLLAFDVRNARRLFAPVRYISTAQAAPLVAVLIKGFDATALEEAMTSGRETLMTNAVTKSQDVSDQVKEAVNPIAKEIKALKKAIDTEESKPASSPDAEEVDLVRQDMHNVERSIENAENLLQAHIASHGRHFGIDLNEQVWKMEDSVSMFKHDMHNMRDLAEHMSLDNQILKMFTVFDARAEGLQELLESAHANLTKATRLLETHHLLNTTNQALDAAMQTASLLSPMGPVVLLQDESAASRLGVGLLTIGAAYLSQWL